MTPFGQHYLYPMRPYVLAVLLLGPVPDLDAQRIDSVHVYDALPDGEYTSASANARAWRLHRSDAHHITLKGEDIGIVREGLQQYKPVPHRSGPIPGLRHVAMMFIHGRPVVMGLTADLERLINFTARSEYRLSSMSDHLKVRMILAELVMRH